MQRGGARYDKAGNLLTGRKPSKRPIKKKQVSLYKDQCDHLEPMGYKGSAWVRDAIDEKIKTEKH